MFDVVVQPDRVMVEPKGIGQPDGVRDLLESAVAGVSVQRHDAAWRIHVGALHGGGNLRDAETRHAQPIGGRRDADPLSRLAPEHICIWGVTRTRTRLSQE